MLPKAKRDTKPATKRSKRHPTAPARRFFAKLGPGVITGAADDDPSGIATYSVAGASFGFNLLWTALLSFPLMAAVQLMCARLGLVSGLGLAAVIRRRYSRPVLWFACTLLVVANTVNIGADLGGMSEVTQMITGVSASVWLPLYAGLIVALLIWSSYKTIARIFKWLTLALFAYIISAFLAHPNWAQVLRATFVPRIEWSVAYLATFLGVLGTTISPYLFFWQSAQEVEEDRASGKKSIAKRRGATPEELRAARTDVVTGMAYSNLIMYFIILTAGATLYVSGHRDIGTAREAAEALRPVAGNAAYILFAVGLIGIGMLGVPVLAGSAAYAVSEAMHWRGSLEDRPPLSIKFYAVLAAAMVIGLGLNYARVSAVHMLFWSAVLNGILAAPLIVLVTLLTSDKTIMGDEVSPPLLRWLGWATALVMSAATVAMVLAV